MEQKELLEIADALRQLALRLERLAADSSAASVVSEPEVSKAAPVEPVPVVTPKPSITFALNDRYRFQRELFGNSAAALNDAVEKLAALENADRLDSTLEALNVDTDSDVGREFLAAITPQIQR